MKTKHHRRESELQHVCTGGPRRGGKAESCVQQPGRAHTTLHVLSNVLKRVLRLQVNPGKEKEISNVRSKQAEAKHIVMYESKLQHSMAHCKLCVQVNPGKEKKLSNVRSKQAEEKYIVPVPRILTLEESIGYVQPGELIEVRSCPIKNLKTRLCIIINS